MSADIQALLNQAGADSKQARIDAMGALDTGSSEDVNLAMLTFNEASAKFNAAIKAGQEESNTIRRSSQGQQA